MTPIPNHVVSPQVAHMVENQVKTMPEVFPTAMYAKSEKLAQKTTET